MGGGGSVFQPAHGSTLALTSGRLSVRHQRERRRVRQASRSGRPDCTTDEPARRHSAKAAKAAGSLWPNSFPASVHSSAFHETRLIEEARSLPRHGKLKRSSECVDAFERLSSRQASGDCVPSSFRKKDHRSSSGGGVRARLRGERPSRAVSPKIFSCLRSGAQRAVEQPSTPSKILPRASPILSTGVGSGGGVSASPGFRPA